MRWLTDEDILVLYFELTDEQHDRISKDKKWHEDRTFVDQCEVAKGNNAHIFKLYGQGDMKILLNNIRWSIQDYKTISWWNKDMTKFYEKRRELCQI